MHALSLQIRLVLLLVTLLSYNLCQATTECDFDCTLNRHLNAIQQHDFETFKTTITDDAVIDFILPNGRAFSSREEYLSLLEGWFAETGWHFKPTVVRTIKSPHMGVALLKVSYDEDDRGGKPYHLDHYLTLVFKLQNGAWRLVLDQNTKIEPPPVE